MILSDRDIRRQVTENRIVITPFDPTAVQPASVDIRLGHEFRVFHNYTTGFIDPREDTSGLTEPVTPPAGEPFMLHPGQFVLGTTLETFGLPDDLVARLEGKSSLGRLGLVIHSTAGYIDPGFKGEVTLELSNVASLPIALVPGMWIGHLSFEQLSSPAENPYGSAALNSKYQDQVGPTASHSHRNYQ